MPCITHSCLLLVFFQNLVSSEAVLQQTAAAKAKAQQAVTTVATVEAVAQQLSVVAHEANNTMDR